MWRLALGVRGLIVCGGLLLGAASIAAHHSFDAEFDRNKPVTVTGADVPVVEAMQINLLWFSTLVAVNLQTAFLSPPVAMAAYYLKAVAPKWELAWIYRGMVDFMLLQLIGLLIVFLFPQVALWLPELLFG